MTRKQNKEDINNTEKNSTSMTFFFTINMNFGKHHYLQNSTIPMHAILLITRPGVCIYFQPFRFLCQVTSFHLSIEFVEVKYGCLILVL